MTSEERRPIVVTRSGEVVGRRLGSGSVFKGVPFAKPPVGALRFRPPQPAEKWLEPLDAGAFGPGPIQPAYPMVEIPSGASEDCLTLNVWAPTAPGPHPVLFSIYGGANTIGASSQAAYDGATFSEQGLVFVSANYRLGAFGFMELGGIDPSYAGSGLNGLRDIEAALRWVRDNILAFGGDPDQVTLLGISAGAKNQCALAAMPSARGLFRRMTVMSGGGDTVFRSAEEATPVARALLVAAELGAGDIQGLVSMPASAVLAAQTKVMQTFPRGFPFRPTVDGTTLPHAPIDAARNGATAALDIVVGTNRDEAALMLPGAVANKPFRAGQIANLDLSRMLALEQKYETLLPDLSLADRHIRQLTAEEYWIPSVRFAEAHARAGGRVWMYRFDWAADAGPFAGYAPHGADSPFVYGGHGIPALVHSDDAKPAAMRAHAMWARWARTGSLGLEGGPEWPLYDDRRRLTFILDRVVHVDADPRGDERRLWDGVM